MGEFDYSLIERNHSAEIPQVTDVVMNPEVAQSIVTVMQQYHNDHMSNLAVLLGRKVNYYNI